MAKKSNTRVSAPIADEAVQDLMQAGFTEYEAKVYLSLLSHHPASAYTVSQNSGVPHSRVYDISRRLIKKGYAVSSGTNPEVFSPLSPEELVGKIKRDNEKLTHKLKERLEQVDFTADFDPVWNLHGREEALEKAVELIREGEQKIYIGFWSEEFPYFEKELRAAAERGAQVLMLCYGEIEADFGQVYSHERSYMDDLDSQGRSLDCAVDSAVCISGILGNPGKSQVVWTRNQGLVHSIEGYIIHDFYLAELRMAFGEKMDQLFGANLSKLRKKFYED